MTQARHGNPQIRVPVELVNKAQQLKRSDQSKGQALLEYINQLETKAQIAEKAIASA